MVELLIGMALFAGVSVFLMQAFIDGMGFANRSDTKAAATSIAMQVMEQIKSSPNPYTMVGFVNIPRMALPLPAPYTGISNATTHNLQATVTVVPDNTLLLSTVTVSVYRPADPDTTPLVTLSTVLTSQ